MLCLCICMYVCVYLHPIQVPRVVLSEMGPQLDCVLRRTRLPPVDLEKEALRQPKLTKKKVNREGGVWGRRGRRGSSGVRGQEDYECV